MGQTQKSPRLNSGGGFSYLIPLDYALLDTLVTMPADGSAAAKSQKFLIFVLP